jgi:hypothetical protein
MRLFSVHSCRLFPLFGLVVILTLQACAHRPLLIPSTTPYPTEAIDSILGHMAAQEQRVTTLFCSGKLTSTTRESELEATISIVGRVSPFETRMEFTHPWGAPLAYLIINTNRFEFLVFRDKRMYVGSTHQADLLRYFPFLPDPTTIWGFIRGYPVIAPYARAISPGEGTIDLLDRQGGLIQRLSIDLETHGPKACSYPGKKVRLSYGNFAKEGTVDFAQNVELKSETGKRTVTLHIRQAIFNPTLPRTIFDLKMPEGFKVIDLPAIGDTPDRR